MVSAIDTLLSIARTDDAGAQTADRYEWQAAMAAADGCAAYLQHLNGVFNGLTATQIQVICEYHEDWIVKVGNDAELVSAKHRELTLGPWKTITVLVSDGGVGHLFARWLMSQRQAATRLVSNAATASGDATDLLNCRAWLTSLNGGGVLSQEHQEKLDRCVDAFCRALMMYRKDLPETWQAATGSKAKDQIVPSDLTQAAREFLLVFRFDQKNRPERSVVVHAAPTLYAQPLVLKHGRPASFAIPVWEAVLQIVRVRMRAQGTTERGGLPEVGRSSGGIPPALDLAERTVTLEDIKIAITTAIAHPVAYTPISRPQRITTLGVKMEHGRCADTSIERAEQLKLDYSRYRRDRRNSALGSSAELRLIERILHRIADEETHKVRNSDQPWGNDLWMAVSARLHSSPPELAEFHLDGDLSLGGVSELTAKCRVWFSEQFDVGSAIAIAKQNRDDAHG